MPWPFRQSLTAAVTVVTKDQIVKSPRPRAARWQDEAWDDYRNVGEVRFAARYYGNSLSRTRYFVGQRQHPGDPLTPIDEKNQYADALNAYFFQLKGRDGTLASLARYFGIQQFVAGESFLVGPDGSNSERWEMLSGSEVDARAKKRIQSDGTPGEDLPEGAFIARLWTRDPQWSNEPDSPLRAVLDIVEGLRVVQALQTAGDRSQLAVSGIMAFPAEADLPVNKAENENETDRLQLVDQVIDAAARVMDDPTQPEAYIPLFVTMKADLIEKIRHIKIERPIDTDLANRIEKLVTRFARGIDLPPEIISGTGATNHWSSWNISMEIISVFVGPAAFQFCEDLYTSFFLPAMDKIGIPAEDRWQYGIGYDMTDLVVNPNRSRDATTAFDRFAISFEALRRESGFSEDDAPTDAEIEERRDLLGLNLPEVPGTRQGGASPSKDPGPLPEGDPGAGQGPPGEENSADQATLVRYTQVGKIIGAAEEAILAAREVALTRAKKSGLDTPDPLGALRQLGKSRAMGNYRLDPDKLFAGQFATLQSLVAKWMFDESDVAQFMSSVENVAWESLFTDVDMQPRLTTIALQGVFRTADRLRVAIA